MSKRPINAKRAAHLRKEFERTSPQAFVDVYKWLKLRGHARTREEAVHLVLAGCLRGADGTPIGILGEGDDRYAAKFIKAEDAAGMYLLES